MINLGYDDILVITDARKEHCIYHKPCMDKYNIEYDSLNRDFFTIYWDKATKGIYQWYCCNVSIPKEVII